MLRRKDTNPTLTSLQGNTPEAAMAGKLAELCGGNTELYQSLARLLILDPKKVNIPQENFLKEAQDFEAKGNRLRAEVGYRVAGALSLYQGDADGVKRYLSKASEIAGDSRGEYKFVLQHLDDAVSVAKKYYGGP